MTELPPSSPTPPSAPGSGLEVDGAGVDASRADHLLDTLEEEGGEALRRLGFRTRLRLLAEAGERFLDPADPLRIEAEARIPDDAALSPRAAREVVEGMAREWTLDRLGTALRADFPDPDVLDGFRPGPREGLQRAVPPRLLVQVGSGNVPGTTATALLRGLLVGAPTLVKPGVGDGVLPGLLARAVAEAGGGDGARGGGVAGSGGSAGSGPGAEMARGLLVARWKGGEESPLETRALARADRVVVYGGDEAVEAVRRRVSPGVPVVVYGPRIGGGVVLRDAAGAHGPVEDAARAILAYGQRGCVSPHQVWVEEGGARTPETWARALAVALADLASGYRLPITDPAFRAFVEGARWREASGSGEHLHGGGAGAEEGGPRGRSGAEADGWAVLWDPSPGGLEPGCGGHLVRVRPLARSADLPPLLEPARNRLQTLAVEGGEPGRSTLALHLARVGVTRITTFRDQPWPPAWWRQDGVGPLATLTRWATLEPADRAGPGA